MTTPNYRPLPSALQELLPAALWAACTRLPCGKGDQLFAAGKKPERMFYVARGEVVLQRLGSQGDTLVLQRARQGFVAEASLQSPRYHCGAVVTVAGELVAIPVEAIRPALLADPAFALRWMDMLNQELKRLRVQCERLSIKGVKNRLLHLVETEGHGGSLPLGAGLKSIASEIGVTHEALYRTVAELEKQGLLRRDDGHLSVIRAAPPPLTLN